MLKILVTIFLILTFLHASEVKKCDKCSIAKDYMKCTYYVEQKSDLSHQDSCRVYAREMERNNNNARASWYYLAAGDFDDAIRSGQKAIKVGEDYAAEHIAEAYLIKNDKDKAREFFKKTREFFKKIGKSSKDAELMTIRHFSILSHLYPKRFDLKLAEKLYNMK
jgi:tetratricopeptide (TPR) repeat protein